MKQIVNNDVIIDLHTANYWIFGCIVWRGYVGPGGIGQDYPKAEKCTGGMAGYIDRNFFGYNHIYQHSNPKVCLHSS